MISLPSTICFCLCGDQVLMLYRSKPPNAHCWNGLGGKIEAEAGETPLRNIYREVMEEAEVDLHQAQEVRFAGLVTWMVLDTHPPSHCGMYAFLAYLAPDFPIQPDRLTPEGLLSWKRIDWVCDRSNPAVVDNIPHFLPQMLTHPQPQEYCCSYQNGVLQAVAARTLPDGLPDSKVVQLGGMVEG